MKIYDLKIELKKKGIPSYMYSINSDKDEHYCIIKVGVREEWEIYYSERGTKVDLVIFQHEDEAVEYFFKLICDDYLKYISRH